jgi:hypothetical protein
MRQNQFYDKLRELGYSGNVNQMLKDFDVMFGAGGEGGAGRLYIWTW